MTSPRKSQRLAKRSNSTVADGHEQLHYMVFDGEKAGAHSQHSADATPILVKTSSQYLAPEASHPRKVLCKRNDDGTFEDNRRYIPTTADSSNSTTPSVTQEDSTTSEAPVPRKKARMSAKAVKDAADLAKAKTFGEIPDIPVGSLFLSREALHRSLVHRGLVSGIFYDATMGCFSVVLSGGYPDDTDEGYNFVYSGQGGRVYGNQRTGTQSRHQILDKGNAALMKSCETGQPVRVVRGYKGRSVWAPKVGFRYDGLYEVRIVWEFEGVAGLYVFKFTLVRIPGQPDIDRDVGEGSYSEEELRAIEREENSKRERRNARHS
ncbi:MAG: hypothetical protein M1836_004558 [Candelina mexicana]|nr:MAG: hypothetical protein M1836_004558 [Candelina mexicana]